MANEGTNDKKTNRSNRLQTDATKLVANTKNEHSHFDEKEHSVRDSEESPKLPVLKESTPTNVLTSLFYILFVFALFYLPIQRTWSDFIVLFAEDPSSPAKFAGFIAFGALFLVLPVLITKRKRRKSDIARKTRQHRRKSQHSSVKPMADSDRTQSEPLHHPEHTEQNRKSAEIQTEYSKLWYQNTAIMALGIFLSALALRLLIVTFFGMDTTQIYDFGRAYEQALIDPPIHSDHYRIFSNWALYSAFLHELMFFFGKNISVGIIANSVISSLSCSLIFLNVLELRSNKRFALWASLVFAFWPSNLYHQLLLSPDYLNIVLMLLALWLIQWAWRPASTRGMRIFLFFSAGCLLGMASFFKSVHLIVYVALMIILILQAIDVLFVPKQECKSMRKIIFENALLIVLMILCSTITIRQTYRYLDEYIGARVNRDPSAHFLYIGLNPYSEGRWSEESSRYIALVHAHQFDYEAAGSELMQTLQTEIQTHHHLNRDFFEKKIDVAWQNDIHPMFLNRTITQLSSDELNNHWEYWDLFFTAYYLSVMVLAMIGAVRALIMRERKLILYVSLLIFGYMLLLLVSEVQSRYKIIVYPYFAILAAYGIDGVAKLGRKAVRLRGGRSSFDPKM